MKVLSQRQLTFRLPESLYVEFKTMSEQMHAKEAAILRQSLAEYIHYFQHLPPEEAGAFARRHQLA
jgi:hypothetical protein